MRFDDAAWAEQRCAARNKRINSPARETFHHCSPPHSATLTTHHLLDYPMSSALTAGHASVFHQRVAKTTENERSVAGDDEPYTGGTGGSSDSSNLQASIIAPTLISPTATIIGGPT